MNQNIASKTCFVSVDEDEKLPPKGSSHESEVPFVKPNDVLFGRGKLSYKHEGNIRFRNLLIARAPEYKANTSKQFRKLTAREVIAKVQKDGGRFLCAIGPAQKGGVSEKTRWRIVSAPLLTTKVKQALRDMALSQSLKTPKVGKNDYIRSPQGSIPAVLTPISSPASLLSSLQGSMLPHGGEVLHPLLWPPTVSPPQVMRTPMLTEGGFAALQSLLVRREQQRNLQMSALLLLRQEQEQTAMRQLFLMDSAARRSLLRQTSHVGEEQINNNVDAGSRAPPFG